MSFTLSETDLQFVVETVADQRTDHENVMNLVRGKEDLLNQMLDDPKLGQRLLNDAEALVRISPSMLFHILLRQVRREIQDEACIYDYEVGSRPQRIPVFAVPEVTDLLSESEALDYLAQMLASFAKTGSITFTWTEGGTLHRQHFCDMDMDDMMRLSRLIDAENRPYYYRRVGDIALFLSGVFPDHASHSHCLTPRSTRQVSHGRNLRDYEREGRHFYQKAAEEWRGSRRRGAFLDRLAEEFATARRALNVLSERYMAGGRTKLFGTSGIG